MVKDKILLLSEKPGCYLMKDESGEIIYVGKAKNLKNRVSQYFTKPHDGKTSLMVSKVVDFDTIITKSEKEALLLEANLIHKYNPKYNILLKDDKSYPYVKLSLINHPKLEIARSISDKNAKYFGPFSDSSAAYKSIDLLNRIFPIRKCRTLPKKECLYYHLGMCMAPCINKVEKKDYEPIIQKISDFYAGDMGFVKVELTKKMKEYSEKMEYEEAQKCKIMLDYLQHLTIKQNVELTSNDNIDFFSSHFKEGFMSIAVFIYRNGILINKESSSFELVGEMKDNFESYIINYYTKRVKPKQIIVPEYLDAMLLEEALEIKVNNSKIGKKKEILDMVGENAVKELEVEFAKSNNKTQLLKELKSVLNLKSAEYIELYDNSHYSGEDAIGVKVCYVNGVPNKKLYRKYIIRGEQTKDDLASMKEVLYRRLYKIISENDYTPNLIILDGGKNQIEVAKGVLNDLNLSIPLCGLVKNEKHVTRGILKENGEEIILDKKGPLFYFLMNMQDEVHRYAIKSHINRRSKSLTSSILDNIKGLGEKRKNALLSVFGSVEELKKAKKEEISQYVPEKLAIMILNQLNNL